MADIILLVADNPISRNIWRATLETDGYDVVVASDGKTAMELAAARRPDVAVLEDVLADMDGLVLLARLRSGAGPPDVPAVVITGSVSLVTDLRARSDGSTQVLAKPVDTAQLLEVVRAQLAPETGRGGGQRILVVDDEALNLKLASLQLQGAGYEVETASGGEEALRAARRRRPDAVLSDVMMPAMDGFTFCREARRDGALAGIPIILVSSAYVVEADRDLAVRVGANALVVRTPELREALAALEPLLRGDAGAPAPATDGEVTALHRERLQVQLDRQFARNQALIRDSVMRGTALSIMSGLSEVLAQPRDVPEILGDVLVRCLDAAGLSTGLLYATEPGGRLTLQAHFGIPAGRKADAEALFGHSQLMRRIAEAGTPVALSSSAEDADPETRDFVARLGHSSVLVVPFVVLGQTFGELVLASEAHDLSEGSWIGFARSLALEFAQTLALGQSVKDLAASEARMKSVLDAALDGVITMDEHGRVTSWNAGAEALFGWSGDEAIGATLADLIIPERYRADHARGIARFLESGQGPIIGRRIELSALRRDASEFPVELTVTALKEGERYFFNAFVADITDRKSAEEALKQAQRRLEHVVTSSPAVLYSLIPQGTAFPARWISENIERLLGYTQQEALDQDWWPSHLHPEDTERVFAELPALFTADHLAQEYRFQHKDGTYRWLRAELRLLRDDEGRPEEAVGSWSDVTPQKEAELKLRESEEHYLRAQKMEAVGQLAGGVAHDFNNLLGVIMGYTELLMRELPADSLARKRSEEIRRAAERAAALTRQLLAFGRRQVLQPTVLDLNDVVAEVEKMLRRLISANIQIVTVAGAGLGRVRADAGQIEQVLLNLAINARDAMPSGGRLGIETANVDIDETFTRINPDARPGPHVMLAVSDTGHGMDAQTMSRIFEPFFTTKAEGKGTGLGLATVYGIVRQSGGTVNVYSGLGHGTTFTIYLPRVEAKVATLARVDGAVPVGGTETVLVVEDAESLRMLVRELLESAGYAVLDAEAPDKAIALLESTPGPIHLVLTDMVMPRMSGLELARRIATLKPEARVVFMSGYSNQAMADEGTLPPGTLFLQKPFTLDDLMATIRRALDAAPSSGR